MINWSTIVFLIYQIIYSLLGWTRFNYLCTHTVCTAHFKWCLFIYCAFAWPSGSIKFSEWLWRSGAGHIPLQAVSRPLLRPTSMDSFKQANIELQFSFGWKRCFTHIEYFNCVIIFVLMQDWGYYRSAASLHKWLRSHKQVLSLLIQLQQLRAELTLPGLLIFENVTPWALCW